MKILDGREYFYQWDSGVYLVDDTFTEGEEIHFSNAAFTSALTVKAKQFNGEIVAEVPNILLQIATQIKAYHYIQDELGNRTIAEVEFPVKPKKKPDDYVYTETEVVTIQKFVDEAVQKALENTTALPLDNGEGENALVQGNAVNKAIAANSIAFGSGTHAGSKAFRILSVNAERKQYFLDSVEGIQEAITEAQNIGEEYPYYSIYYRYRRSKFGQIVSVDASNNSITVNNQFIPNVSDEEKEEYLPEAYIYVVGKPELGTLVIGETSIVTGTDNVAAEKQSDIGGYGSIGDGRYSFSRGLYNTTGYAGATFGQENENLGLKGFIGGGQQNYVGPTVERAAAFNFLNQVLANDGFVAGIGNIVDRVVQAKFGKYSRSTTALFAIGNGTGPDTKNRSNAFAVFEDGHAEIKKTSTNDLSIANRLFVMEAIADAIKGIINGAPDTYDTFKEIADYISSDKTGSAALISRVAEVSTAAETAQETADEAKETAENVANSEILKLTKSTNGESAYVLFGENGVQKPRLKVVSAKGTANALAQYKSNSRLADKNVSSWSFDSYADEELPNKRVILEKLNDYFGFALPCKSKNLLIGSITETNIGDPYVYIFESGLYMVNITGKWGVDSVNITAPIYISLENGTSGYQFFNTYNSEKPFAIELFYPSYEKSCMVRLNRLTATPDTYNLTAKML